LKYSRRYVNGGLPDLDSGSCGFESRSPDFYTKHMKRTLLSLLAILTLSSTGCNNVANKWNHFKSATIGITRTITLYSADGKPIRKWTTSSTLETSGGILEFQVDGKSTKISGTFIVEE
jgi:hypothetical protein